MASVCGGESRTDSVAALLRSSSSQRGLPGPHSTLPRPASVHTPGSVSTIGQALAHRAHGVRLWSGGDLFDLLDAGEDELGDLLSGAAVGTWNLHGPCVGGERHGVGALREHDLLETAVRVLPEGDRA